MTVAVIAVSLLIAVIVHEAAHALALRRMGIPISHAGLGLPWPPVLEIQTPWLPFTLTFSPWLLGAYVEPDHRYHAQLDALPYRSMAWFANAGIVANFLLGLVLIGISNALAGQFIVTAVAAGATAVLWIARKIVAAYVLPAVAIPLFVALMISAVSTMAAAPASSGFAGLGELVPTGLAPIIGFAGTMSITVGVLNTLPLAPLDNGTVIGELIQRWAPSWAFTGYRYAGYVVLVVLIAATIGSDLLAIATAAL